MTVKVDWNRPAMKRPVNQAQKALVAEGMMIERDVKMSMKTQGEGRLYMIGKNRDIPHWASKAGDPPAVLTGRLRASITTAWTGGQRPIPDSKAQAEDAIGVPPGDPDVEFKVVVGTNVNYGVFLELGTSRMAPRPFMRPVLEQHRADIEKRLGTIVRQAPMQTLREIAQEVGEFGTD